MADLSSWRELEAEFRSKIDEHGSLYAELGAADQWYFPDGESPRTTRIFAEIATKAADKMSLPAIDVAKDLWQLWLEFMDREGWRKAAVGLEYPSSVNVPTRGLRWHVIRNRIERAERQFTNLFQRSAACCQDLAEREEANGTAPTPVAESVASPPFIQVMSMGSSPSRRSIGTPSLDVQRTFPLKRYSFTDGPIDETHRADLYDEIGWLAREVQVLEGPPGLPPSEALDRLLHRITGCASGSMEVRLAINELRKHCRASGIHRLETGEADKAAAFQACATKFESLNGKYFGASSPTVASEKLHAPSEERFSEQHKQEFQELLLAKVELHAVNISESKLDFGPWRFISRLDDLELQNHLETRFRAAAKKAAIAAGAPARANLFDWWVSKLARGNRLGYIQNLLQLSIDFCAELESNAKDLKPLVGQNNSSPGLRRDRYPCDHPIGYSLYTIPHVQLSAPDQEYAFWKDYVLQQFREAAVELAGRRRLRCWIDHAGKPIHTPKEDYIRSVKERLGRFEKWLKNVLVGVAYDLAVLQANYAIDRSSQDSAVLPFFNAGIEQLQKDIGQAIRPALRCLGLSWKKVQLEDVDLATPFKVVEADLRHFLGARESYTSPAPDRETRANPSLAGRSVDPTEEPPTKPQQHGIPSRRKRQTDSGLQQLRKRVRKLHDEGLTHRQICDRLANSPRPPHAGWRDLDWPNAYKRHPAAVTKWLSDACRDLPSHTN